MMRLPVATCKTLQLLACAVCLAVGMGCAHKPPTIAHTHIGHAVTGFDGTPGEKGLFTVAEERAREALTHAQAATGEANDLGALKRHVDTVVEASVSENFGLKRSVDEAARHIGFAATADDASENVRYRAKAIQDATDEVVKRCDLITLLGNDVQSSSERDEARVLADQIQLLAKTNLEGGTAPDGSLEHGVAQIRAMIDAMIETENPDYVPVDRWYLFHLVRLPDCDTCWAWRKWANSSNRGY